MTHHRPNPGTLAGDGDFLTGSEGPKNTPTPKIPQPVPSIIATHFDLSDIGDQAAVIVRSDGKPILVDRADHARLNQYRWFPAGTNNGYAGRSVTRNGKSRVCYMHREVMAPAPGLVVDHANGDTLDNRRSNLRICTRAENSANRTVCLNHTGFLGIGFDPAQGRYQAAVTQNGSRFRGPWRLTAQEAAKDYDCLARGVHGEFARLNFPEPGEQGVSRPGGAPC
ncbi:HNH endonuclease [Hwanghaeella sp. 1Z406]|uniref:HNH endonuclease n=1 Tax=Hwanghaeella sp. 1Z406 TaxID=3402811 RepID=UPI003B680781